MLDINATAPDAAPKPDSLVVAEALVQSAARLATDAKRTNAYGGKILWKQHGATAAQILAEMTPATQAKTIVGSVLVRLMVAVRECSTRDDAIAHFLSSSPVPADKSLRLLDSADAEVDLSPPVAALLAAIYSVQTVAVEDLAGAAPDQPAA